MTKTTLIGTDSTTKQVTMTRWAHQLLSDISDLRNRRMTQGVVSYEALLFSEDFEDSVSHHEEMLNEKLEKRNVDVEQVDSVGGLEREQLEEVCAERVRVEEKDPYGRQQRIKVWIPEYLEEQAEWSRGWGSKIEEALIEMAISAYRDRTDRINCKREILNYISNDEEPEHEVAAAIVQGQCDRFDIPRDLELRFGEKLPYERDDLSYGDLEDIVAADNDMLTQKQWGLRQEAFRRAHKNDDKGFYRGRVYNHFRGCFDLSDEQAEKQFERYNERYNIDYTHPLVSNDVTLDNFVRMSNEFVFTIKGEVTEEEAMLVDNLFKYLEEDGESSIHASEIVDVMDEAGLISDSDAGTVNQKIDSLHSEFGLSHLKYIKKGRIYLSISSATQ